jgi:hypothetical protein
MKLYFKKKQNKLPDENAACLPSDVRISNPTPYQPSVASSGAMVGEGLSQVSLSSVK